MKYVYVHNNNKIAYFIRTSVNTINLDTVILFIIFFSCKNSCFRFKSAAVRLALES